MVNKWVSTSLTEGQQSLYHVEVGLMHQAGSSQMTFSFSGLLGEQVAFERVKSFDLSGSGHLEGLFSTGMGLYFGHLDRIWSAKVGKNRKKKRHEN